MARYTGSVCRLCRREGMKLFLKGDRCFTEKCAIEKRNYVPGQHGKGARIKKQAQGYGLQLREKQKVKRLYGMLEGQFALTFQRASSEKGVSGELLLQKLERRLCNVIYRLGFGGSQAQGRQLVRHGHVRVNDRKIDIPSYQVKVGDVITLGAARGQERVRSRPRSSRSRGGACRAGSSSTPPISPRRCSRCPRATTSASRSRSS